MGRRPKKSQQPNHRNFAVPAVCGFILLAVVIVFGRTLRHEFVNYDDQKYVYENPQVGRGLTTQGIAWAFTATHASNWHPLTWFSHMLDCQLYGLHAGGHHATNVLLHAAVAILLFLVLWRMTGDLWPSALVAAVFAVHPLRAESVAWTAERKDVLSGLFFVLTLGAYVGYVRRQFSIVRYLAVVVLFALGLMAKPMLVTLPFVLLLLDYWPLGRVAGTLHCWGGSCTATPGATVQLSPQQGQTAHGVCLLLLEKVPLLALAAASCVATAVAQHKSIVPLEALSFCSRMANVPFSYAAYLGQLFCPVGLAVYYPHPGSDLPIWKAVAATGLLAGISVGALAWRRRFPYLFVGWFWYLGMFVPVIGLMQVGAHAMADRYTYLPQIGLCIALVWGVAQVSRSWPYRRWVCGIVSALVAAILMGCAWRQTSFWRDSETLWTRALACTSRNVMAHNNLGAALVNQGRFDEAIIQYRKALEIRPDNSATRYNLILALADSGRTDEAMQHYPKILKIEFDRAEVHYNLGVILDSSGRLDEAVAHYQKALEIDPNCAESHNNLGNILVDRYRLDEAVAHYRKALEIQPDYAQARQNLDFILSERERMLQVLAGWRKSLQAKPNNIALLNELAWALATNPNASLRNGAEAVKLAQRATKLSAGRQPAVLDTLAAAYAEAGRFLQAVETARKALELARQQNKPALVKSIQAKIKLYKAGIPFRYAPIDAHPETD